MTLDDGLKALQEMDRVLGLTAARDAGIGAVMQRSRGLSGGELLLHMLASRFNDVARVVSYAVVISNCGFGSSIREIS